MSLANMMFIVVIIIITILHLLERFVRSERKTSANAVHAFGSRV